MSKEVKKDCFAYREETDDCHCLNYMKCKGCRFYKHYCDIENNVFYAYSWKSAREFLKELNDTKIDKSLIYYGRM